MLNKIILTGLSATLFFGLAACSSFSPYKMEIRQGNYITQEMRNKIKTGMTRQQVVNVLGSPLISDVFHANRWDYMYRYVEKDQLLEQQRLTLFFDGEYLKRIDDSQLKNMSAAASAKK